jgi:hypothetical protein
MVELKLEKERKEKRKKQRKISFALDAGTN